MLLSGALAYAVVLGILTVAAITKVVYDNKNELEKKIEKLEKEIKILKDRSKK